MKIEADWLRALADDCDPIDALEAEAWVLAGEHAAATMDLARIRRRLRWSWAAVIVFAVFALVSALSGCSRPAPVALSCPRGSALYSYTSTAWGPTLSCRPPHLAPVGAVEVEPVQR